jgi:hypothetical protein
VRLHEDEPCPWPPRWTHDTDPDHADIGLWPAGAPDVVETDNPVVAVFLGADGVPLIELRERRTVPFGYQR